MSLRQKLVKTGTCIWQCKSPIATGHFSFHFFSVGTDSTESRGLSGTRHEFDGRQFGRSLCQSGTRKPQCARSIVPPLCSSPESPFPKQVVASAGSTHRPGRRRDVGLPQFFCRGRRWAIFCERCRTAVGFAGHDYAQKTLPNCGSSFGRQTQHQSRSHSGRRLRFEPASHQCRTITRRSIGAKRRTGATSGVAV